jgi:hypothetical protein
MDNGLIDRAAMEMAMLKKWVLVAAVPAALLALMQPAEARRLFWWETANPYDGPPPGYYDVPPQDAYANPHGRDAMTPEERFNQRQYNLYQREMAGRYGHSAYYGVPPDASYGDPPYADPVYPQHKKLKVLKPKKLAAKPVLTPITTAPIVKTGGTTATLPVQNDGTATASATTSQNNDITTTASTTPVKPQAGGVNCDKGAGIVSSFGFSNVASKSCIGKSLVYSAERGGNKFEVEVNGASGELTAVKKL